MKSNKARGSVKFILPLVLGLVLVLSIPLFAGEKEEEEKEKPARALAIYPEYTGVVIPKEKEVRMDLIISNDGKSDESVFVKIIEKPKGWKAKIKTYDYEVTGVHVEEDDTRTLTFKAEPPKDVKPGKYLFKFLAESADGVLRHENQVEVIVKSKSEKGEKEEEEDIVLTTSYPVLQGPSDAKFEFSLDIENKMDKEATFNLSAKGPKDWIINFKPAYEEKYISSIRLKDLQSKSVAVEVDPPNYAEAGKYPIEVVVSSEGRKAEAKLTVVLTGKYKLDAGTATGLLSLTAQRGRPSRVALYVKNSGTAKNHDITFMSFHPENWKVEFKPEKIDFIEPGEIKQVEVVITPDEEALVGDYSVSVNIKGEKASDDVELRVTVKASPVWGWVGIGIILFVIAGLCALFVLLGRR
jgi:uncharacterized membrane protein